MARRCWNDSVNALVHGIYVRVQGLANFKSEFKVMISTPSGFVVGRSAGAQRATQAALTNANGAALDSVERV